MKKLIITLAILTLSNAAFAEKVCGVLGSHTVRPVCVPGRACPHWIRLQYDISVPPENDRMDVHTSSSKVLRDLAL